MLSAQNRQVTVIAWEVTKENGPFSCAMCNGEAIVKKGRIKVHHFAHVPPSDCAYGIGESEKHRRAKKEIYEALAKHSHVTELQLERPLDDVRPDISFRLHTTIPVAIEVQISTLSLDTIDRRTKAYANKGIYLLWVSPYEPTLIEGEKYSPRRWEKYLHIMYFGNVYYWLSDETLLPVHFDKYQLYVKESSWWEGEGADAEERSEGGYYRRSKRFRTPRFLERVKITELSPMIREPWSWKEISVPAARLWSMDTRSSAATNKDR